MTKKRRASTRATAATRRREGVARAAPTADPARRPTKAERKDEARRQRGQIRARMAKQRRNRRIATGIALALAAVVAVFAVTRARTGTVAVTQGARQLLAAAPAAAKAAGCGAVQTIGPYRPSTLDRAHIGTPGAPATPPPISSYTSVPPASGPHNPRPLDAGVYSSPPPIDRAIHSLEHASVIIWYDPSASGKELDRIKSFFGEPANQDHIIVAPYDYPDQGSAGKLPAGTQMALVAWHHLDDCARPSLAAAFGFVAHYRFPPYGGEPYLGDAPEQGVPI